MERPVGALIERFCHAFVKTNIARACIDFHHRNPFDYSDIRLIIDLPVKAGFFCGIWQRFAEPAPNEAVMSNLNLPVQDESEICADIPPKPANLLAVIIVIMVVIICGGLVACAWIHFRSELNKYKTSTEALTEELNASENRVAELWERINKIRKERNEYRKIVTSLPGVKIPIGKAAEAPRIDAVVTAYKKQGRFVVLNVGSEHGVKTGYYFTIFDGGNFVAQVEVEKVLMRLCSTRVIFGTGEIREGMQATTRLY
jgi:hypothetical protein